MNLKLGYTRLIIDTCRKHGLSRNQAAYVLATAKWETAHTMKPVVEAYWLSEAWRKKNLRYYPWHGRGFVQLTWEANYQKAAKKLGVPLDRKPELALDPKIAADVLVRGMMEGWFTTKDLGDYVSVHAVDYVNARRVVNGTDKAHDIAKLASQYDAALRADGYAPGPRTPANPETPSAGILGGLWAFLKRIFGIAS